MTKQGRDATQPERQRDVCQSCKRRFDDLTDTIVAGPHQPLRVWILCLYVMGLTLSNPQSAHELDRNTDDGQQMTRQLRQGIVRKKPSPPFTNQGECDAVSLVAGHKGKPDEGVKKGGAGGGDASRETWTRHTRPGEAPDLRDDPARWRGRASDARVYNKLCNWLSLTTTEGG